MAVFLEIENLNVHFDTTLERVNALDNVSLAVNYSEIVGIIGSSGSGKSTLAKTILGLFASTQETTGVIRFDQKNLLDNGFEEWRSFRKSNACIVFQNPLLNLNPSITIEKHFKRLAREHSKNTDSIGHALSDVGLDENTANILSSYPHQLSGGQQQRVLIAMAIVQNAKLMILDEPMSSLDTKNQNQIVAILRELVQKKKTSIIIISHDIGVIELITERVYVLDLVGKVIESGITNEVINNPQDSYTRSLVEARKLIPTSDKKSAVEIISLSEVTHKFQNGGFLDWNKDDLIALDEVSMSIVRGSITGIVGPSGSGKSTIVKLLLGIEQLQKGKIIIDKISIEPGAYVSTKSLSRIIQLIPQNTEDALNPRMLLVEQLREVFRIAKGTMDTFDQVVRSICTDLDLSHELLNRYPNELSGGEIQRMAIARALLIRPEILVLDESLSALDMLVQKKTIGLIVQLNRVQKMTIIIISHDRRIISHCCHQLLQLQDGRLIND